MIKGLKQLARRSEKSMLQRPMKLEIVYDARLLGRDISKIAYTSTTNRLIEILSRESKNKRGHGIAMDVLQGDRFADESYEKVSAYFDAL